MVQQKWKDLEDLTRTIATLIFGKACNPGRIAGVNFDGVIELNELETIVIEISKQNDLDKVRQGITRLTLARQTLSAQGTLVRGYIVLSKMPTQSMIDAADAAKVTVASASQFAAIYFEFERYREARLRAAFGSSIDPLTGHVDPTSYVPVKYSRINGGPDLTVEGIADLLLGGRNVVLLGEYGSGKSRCIREIFSHLSSNWDLTFQYPYAINLRECWGLERSDEIVRRGMFVLGLDDLAQSAVKALNRDTLILLLDGFDEVGSQSWSTDEARLRQLRARALTGVKDLVKKTSSGTLIAGREHYFSSNDEMMSALGLTDGNTIVVKAKDQFTDDELEQYFDAAGIYVDLPTWLPKKPLICQTISQLSDSEVGEIFGISGDETIFWQHFMRVVCLRDARINAFFDADTIYQVFVALSRITRSKPSNMGPISQRELQDAFEAVIGQLPVEDASVMLQRLPSLGRIGPESQDRQFVDLFILDGLRAKDISRLPELDEDKRKSALEDQWSNPLGNLGQAILAGDMAYRLDTFVQLANRAATARNSTLSADIIASLGRVSETFIELGSLRLSNAPFIELNLKDVELRNLRLEECTFETLVLPNSPPRGTSIKHSLAGKVAGAASFAGLPAWVQLESVDKFDSVQTVAQIRKAGLSPAHEILVAILKKIFLQKGSGRKEEALLRGFGGGEARKLASKVLPLLLREDILTRHKGDEGWVYHANNSEAARIRKMLDQLRSSDDPLWTIIGDLNK